MYHNLYFVNSVFGGGGVQVSVPGINIVTSVFSLADQTLERAFLHSGKLDLGLVSASSDGIEP